MGVTILVLALGIGANTAVFAVVNAVLLRPLPYPQSGQLCIVLEGTQTFSDAAIGYADYMDWCAGQNSFSDLAIVRHEDFNASFTAGSGLTPEKIGGACVSANYLSVLGMRPTHGRDFTAAEDEPDGPASVLLSDNFWRRRFDADPAVVGQRLTMDGVSYEIIGVLPPQIDYPPHTDVVVALRDRRGSKDLIRRGNRPGWWAVGRLRPGVTIAQCQTDLEGIATELARLYPDTNAGVVVCLHPWLEYRVRKLHRSLWLLFDAVGSMLLITCANVADLQLARALARTKEFAVRTALGASRGCLLWQLLTESILLGLLGGALGALLARWLLAAIVAAGTALPRFREVRLDLPALLFAVAASVGTGIIAGLWPAWRMSRVDALAVTLRESSARGTSGGAVRSRVREALVIIQVALSVLLLTAASIALRGLYSALYQPLGFRPEGLLTASLLLPDAQYPPEETRQFDRTFLARVRALADVQQAAQIVYPPFSGITDRMSPLHVLSMPADQIGRLPFMKISFASSDYFQTMGMPVLSGRDFGPQDTTDGLPVAIIDENLARKYFADRDPVGQRLDGVDLDRGDNATLTIIGVVPHVRHDAPGENPAVDDMPQLYADMEQFPQTNAQLIVRVKSGSPLRLADELKRTMFGLDAGLPLFDVSAMEENIADHMAPQRAASTLLGMFAAVALGLAAMGIYGVMSLSVTQRTRELGIRLALGAQRWTVLALVMRQGLFLVGVGLGLGLTVYFSLSRMLTHFGVGASDPLTTGAVCMVLAGAALLACWMPVLRVVRLDPANALHDE